MPDALKFSLGLMLLASFTAMAEDTVERKPLIIGTKIETGQIVDGEKDLNGGDPDDFFLSQIGVSLTQEVIVNQRLEMKVGVGGVFYYSFPNNRGNAASQGTKFGPGVSQAQALYKFGDPATPWGALRIGFFPYKYNPDAKNLGEYLFRSMPYPTFVFTGGWAYTDNAQTRAQGLQLSLSQFDGKLKHDFLLTSERDFRPQGDFTPTYLMAVNAGPFQFGAGVSLFHFLPIQGDRLESKNMAENSVVHFNAFPAFKAVNNYTTAAPDPDGPVTHAAGDDLLLTVNDLTQVVADMKAELADTNQHPEYIDDPIGLENAQNSLQSQIDSLARDTVTFTTKGTKLMARASFSIQKLFPLSFLGPEDLKIYGEVAMLGVENQPGFYEDRWQRLPIMMGFNLPTFKMLDALSLEVEYFRSTLPDNFDQVLIYNFPSYNSYSLLFNGPNKNRRDDWKWSLYASKKVATGLSVKAQVANDHFRTVEQNNLFTGRSLMLNPGNWYYVVSINFGI